MNRFHVFAFVFLAIFTVSTARVYDEKSDAIKEIERKFKEAKDLQAAVLKAIKTESQGVNSTTGEAETFKHLKNRIEEAKSQYEIDADAVIRTAIVKSKPVAVIYCIRSVSNDYRVELQQLEESSKKRIYDIKVHKYQKINFDDYAVNAIIKGLEELKSQSIEKINKAEGTQVAQAKKDAIARCDSALQLLGEIEVSVSEPNLPKEYIKMKQTIDKIFRESKTVWGEKVEKCLDVKLSE